MSTTHYRQVNRARWDELTAVHARSAFYDLDGFRRGKSTLRPLEREELGDVAGKLLLHLQCHFGLDSLSWSRLGACVVGVDFSEEATELARRLSHELGLGARFICADLYDLRAILSQSFDIVFTSYGVLGWLPDLEEWGRIIAHFLKPGGIFYIAEIHPLAFIFADDRQTNDLKVTYPYFHEANPIRSEPQGSYADREARVEHRVEFEWAHGLGEIVQSLISAGLRIDFLHEFPYCVCDILPGMKRNEDGWWRLKERKETLPLLFSLKATKVA